MNVVDPRLTIVDVQAEYVVYLRLEMDSKGAGRGW